MGSKNIQTTCNYKNDPQNATPSPQIPDPGLVFSQQEDDRKKTEKEEDDPPVTEPPPFHFCPSSTPWND